MTNIPEKTPQTQPASDPPEYLAVPFCPSGSGASGLIYIEQLHAVCENPQRPYLLAVNDTTRAAVIFRPDCKLWTCPICGENRARRLVALGLHGLASFAAENRSTGFVTITSHERLGPEASIAVWPKAWKKLHARLKRAAPGTEYLFIPELHVDGRVHAHGLVIDAPAERWWKDNARACGFGFMSDRQEVIDFGAAAYVSKYAAKLANNSAFPKGTRRYRPSYGWPKLPEFEKTPDWRVTKLPHGLPVNTKISQLIRLNYRVFRAESNSFWADLA